MKCLSVVRLAAAVLACASAHAGAADSVSQAGYFGDGYDNGAMGVAGNPYAPGMAGGGGPAYGPYPGYAGYGPGGPGAGPGGCNSGSPRRCGRRRHHCSFGGNSVCCDNVWDGYCNGDPGCGCGVKVRRRHRPLGCGAGPCVDAATCGTPDCAPHRHVCFLRRLRNRCCPPADACCVPGGAGGMMMDQAPGQPTMAAPNGANPSGSESLEPPAFDPNEPPRPMPDDSAT
jgi:hypothetical protein